MALEQGVVQIEGGNVEPVNVAGDFTTDGLTDAELRASPVPVSGPLTDTQLRATPVPISGTVVTGGLTDTQLRATAVPVSGPLTDTQLRATPVPVSGGLTDAQLRATPVPVTAGASATAVVTTNSVGSGAAVTLLASLGSRSKFVIWNETGTLYVKLGTGASSTSYSVRLTANASWEFAGYSGVVTAIKASGTTDVLATSIQ